MFFKIRRIKSTPENLPPLSTLNRSLVALSGAEHDGVVYWLVHQGQQISEWVFKEEVHARSMTSVGRGYQIKRKTQLNEVPLNALHEIIPKIELREGVEDILPGSIDSYWGWQIDISDSTDKALASAKEFHFIYPDSSESFQDDSSSTSCSQKQLLISMKRKTFKYSQGLVPEPRLNSVITYIPKGNYYIMFGGFISWKNLPTEQFEEVNRIRKKEKGKRTYIEQKFSNRFAVSNLNLFVPFVDDVWKYDILQEKWELLLPATTTLKNDGNRPDKVVNALHHPGMKKIYYVPSRGTYRNWSPYQKFYEYDYLSNKFDNIPLNIETNVEITFSLDLSNDSMVCVYGIRPIEITVFCLKTKKSYQLHPKAYQLHPTAHHSFQKKSSSEPYRIEPTPKLTFMDNFNKLLLVEKGEASIYNHTDRVDHTEFIIVIDWKFMKKKYITPFLEKTRCPPKHEPVKVL